MELFFTGLAGSTGSAYYVWWILVFLAGLYHTKFEEVTTAGLRFLDLPMRRLYVLEEGICLKMLRSRRRLFFFFF